MRQIWRASDNNNESCEEYSKSECFDTDSDAIFCDDFDTYMDEVVV